MADVKISELTAQASASVDMSSDVLALVDTSATQTKKISVENLLSPITIDKSAGTITALGTVTGNVDFNGDLDVDGTTNLDVVDIDGAVDMASTLAVGGNVTLNQSSSASRNIAGDRTDAQFTITGGSSGAEVQLFGSTYTNYAGALYLDATASSTGTNDAMIIMRTGSSPTEVLRLDRSQNATFAGNVLFNGVVQLADVAQSIDFIQSGAINFDSNNDQTGRVLTIGTNRTGDSGGTEIARFTDTGKLGINTTFGENIASTGDGNLTVRSSDQSNHYNMVNVWQHSNSTVNIEQRIGWAFGDDGGAENAFGFAGYVGIGKEGDWVTDANRDSYMSFATALNNTVSEKFRITSDGEIQYRTTGDDHYSSQVEYVGNDDIKLHFGPNYSFESGFRKVLTLDNQKVGIGEENPTGLLELSASGDSNKYLTLDNATGNNFIQFGADAGAYACMWTEYGSGDLYIGTGVKPVGQNVNAFYSSYGGGNISRTAIVMDAFGDEGIKFHTATESTVAKDSAVTNEERMRLDPNGNLVMQNKTNGLANNIKFAGSATYANNASTVHSLSGSGALIIVTNHTNDSSGLFHMDYDHSTVTMISNPGGVDSDGFNNANSGDTIRVYKSAGTFSFTVKNSTGSTKSIGIGQISMHES